MSERIPSVSQGTHVVSDALTLFVGDQIFEGWEDAKLTRELNSCAGDFELQLTDTWRPGQEPWRLSPGQPMHMHAGKQSILTGYIDKVEASMSKSARSITVSGRSKTADLVDCSVEELGNYASLNIKEIAQKFCKPFGISVTVIGDPGEPLSRPTIQPGESVFTLLDRICRERRLLMYPSYEGSLILTTTGTARNPTMLKQGVNILSGKMTYDNSNRFSKYFAKGLGVPYLGTGFQASATSGVATDEGVTRYRPKILMTENPSNDLSTEDRAAYEAHLRAAKALSATVEVQGWFGSDGKLWDINQVVSVDAGFLGIRRQMLIQKVEYNKGNAGTTASITLIRPDAYGFHKKQVKKEQALSWLNALNTPVSK